MENKKAVLCQKTAGVNSYCRVCMVTVQPGKGIYIFGEKAVLRNLAAKMKKYLNLEVSCLCVFSVGCLFVKFNCE